MGWSTAALLLGLLLAERADAGTLKQDADAFVQRTGLELTIVHKPRDAEGIKGASAVARSDVERLLPVVERVLLEYPPEVRGALLEEVVLVGKLRTEDGTPFLGRANIKKHRFVLALGARTTDVRLERTMHHELAHLVAAELEPDAAAWEAAGGRPYVNAPLRKDPEGADVEFPELHGQGFVSRYATKNFQEDFAETAEFAFTRPGRMQALARQFPALQRKLDLLTETYGKLPAPVDLPWTRPRGL